MRGVGGFTPGEWHVVDGGNHWNNPAITNYQIHAKPAKRVFDVAWSSDGELVVEHIYEEADARLIAASKELLAALMAYVAAESEVERSRAETMADAAIAKATGSAE